MAATPMLYDQLEYKMAAAMQGKPYRVVKTSKGLDVPGEPSTSWRDGCWPGGASQKAPSASSRAITPAATTTP